MVLQKKIACLYNLLALIACVLLALFTYLQPGIALEPGLDSSWAYGMNYAFEHNLIIGKDVYFTFGPLGWLEHTAPSTLTILGFSSHFWFICSIISSFLVFILCRKSAATAWHIIPNIVLALVLIFFANDCIQRLLIIAYVCVFLHWRTENTFYLLLMSMTAVVSMMIKFSYGVVVFALYLPYLTTLSLRDKQFKPVIIGIIILPVLYLFCWYGIYGTFSGAAGYLKGGVEFSQGSTSAMALNPSNNLSSMGVFYLAFLCGSIIAGYSDRRFWILMPLCFLGPLFIWSKYAFGREDSGHLSYLISFVFYLGLLWAIFTKKLLQKLACLFMVSVCFFAWQDMSIKAGGVAVFTPHQVFFKPRTFKSRWHLEDFIAIMQNNMAKALRPLQLDPEMRDTIGSSSVDIYPWETLITAANDLNWTPRPSFQSYLTYTPFLDRKNNEFFASPQAPEFIIWHYHAYQDIDNRYPFNSDPLTLQAILQHYTRVECKGGFCLWQHKQQDQLSINENPAVITSSWNSWIDLPTPSSASIIRARIKAQRTILGKLNMAVWKEGGIEIDYRLTNGEIKTHTLVLDNASSGIWASPYMTGYVAVVNPELIDKRSVKSLLSAKPAEGYIEKAELISQGFHVSGWGLVPFKPTASQQVSFLLTNDSHSYIVKAKTRPRPGITEYFSKTGIVDLETSGFDETIDTHDMSPGQYQLHFAVENQGDSRIHTQMPAIMLNIQKDIPENIHNVTAIRLRTTRPWAFAESLTLNWSNMTFTEKSPW